jgi:hypothetical protein
MYKNNHPGQLSKMTCLGLDKRDSLPGEVRDFSLNTTASTLGLEIARPHRICVQELFP